MFELIVNEKSYQIWPIRWGDRTATWLSIKHGDGRSMTRHEYVALADDVRRQLAAYVDAYAPS